VKELVLIGLHAKPDEYTGMTFEEAEALVDVHAAVEQHWNTDNIIIMGDLNADCNYIREGELPTLGLRTDPRFTWLIGDEVDTTASGTDCTYDRCACLREFVIIMHLR